MRSSNLNYRVLGDLVGTQYGDMTGIIQIDGHNNISDLYSLCAKNGIDRDKYFLIGFGFSDFTTDGVGKYGKADCTVLLLETAKYAQTFDEIKDQLVVNPKVDVIKKTFPVDYKDFGKYIKRVDALMLTEMGNYIREMNIIEDDNE
jgi:hypothetical protein